MGSTLRLQPPGVAQDQGATGPSQCHGESCMPVPAAQALSQVLLALRTDVWGGEGKGWKEK